MSPAAAASARARVSLALAAALATLLPSAPAHAQTDYYNTDAGRPITIEDAYPVERRAVELQVAPLRLARAAGGVYTWGIEPEIAIGLLPRTQVELGFPHAYTDHAEHAAGTVGRRAWGLAGIELSGLHNLNVETRLPALGVAADVLLPVGPLAPDKAYTSVKGIATKTFPWARLHVNGQYTFGEALAASDDEHGGELSRWTGGLAVDRTFPLESFLLTAELVARQPLAEAADLAWDAAAGTRYQLSPRVAVDAGGGYRLTGDDRGWFATFGAAVSLGLPWSSRR
jgi:hypothetical protein